MALRFELQFWDFVKKYKVIDNSHCTTPYKSSALLRAIENLIFYQVMYGETLCPFRRTQVPISHYALTLTLTLTLTYNPNPNPLTLTLTLEPHILSGKGIRDTPCPFRRAQVPISDTRNICTI